MNIFGYEIKKKKRSFARVVTFKKHPDGKIEVSMNPEWWDKEFVTCMEFYSDHLIPKVKSLSAMKLETEQMIEIFNLFYEGYCKFEITK